MSDEELASEIHKAEKVLNDLLKQAGKTKLSFDFRDYGCISEDGLEGYQSLEITITKRL